jgi:hypothetical protein
MIAIDIYRAESIERSEIKFLIFCQLLRKSNAIYTLRPASQEHPCNGDGVVAHSHQQQQRHFIEK